MKFDLAPDNREQPDDVLLEDLRSVAERLGVGRLTRERYEAVGRFSPATIAARFKGWGTALDLAGLESSRHFSVRRDECIQDLKRVARRLGLPHLTVAQYREHGRFSEKPFNRHFGGWVGALNAAGLEVSDQYHARVPNEVLFENLEAVWQRLGHQPTVNDMYPPVSRFSAHAYKRRFGGFRKALETFVGASQQPVRSTATVETPVPVKWNRHPQEPAGRSVGWRMRYTVLKRI